MRKLSFRLLIINAILILFAANSYSQWNCRSRLASNLKPIFKDVPLQWASEVTVAEGIMTDRTFFNTVVYGALDYSYKNHQLYVDGGFKRWKNKSDSLRDGDEYEKNRVGLREMFYMYNKDKFSLIAGLHTVDLGDYFLMNERAWGLSYSQRVNSVDWKLSAGTVTQDFARNGTFCSVYYLYNIIPGREYNYLGETFGETNYTGGILRWTPSKKKKEEASSDAPDDEFSEFEEFDDFSEEVSESFEIIKEVGLIAYEEFGSGIDDNELLLGAMAEFNIPAGFYLRTQFLRQSVTGNNTNIYHAKLGWRYDFDKIGRTDLFAGYYGKFDVDSGAYAATSFNNLFLGEVIRLDAVNLPMYQLAVKHSFPKVKFTIKGQYVAQLEGDEMKEIDIELNKRLSNNLGISLILSQIQANVFDYDLYMGRLEIRAVF